MVDLLITLTEIFPRFAVSHDCVGHTMLFEHRWGDLTGEGALPFPVHVLAGEGKT